MNRKVGIRQAPVVICINNLHNYEQIMQQQASSPFFFMDHKVKWISLIIQNAFCIIN